MNEAIFWTSTALILYAYFGYPAFLYLLSIFKNHPVRRGPIQPRITLIITAHNEEKRIREKIENTLKLDYPADKKEIIIASDGSTDQTNEIVRGYRERGVVLVAPSERKGKEYAQGQAIHAASGEVFVFSDVATILCADALLKIVSNFHDPTVGCVSSEDQIISDNGTSAGEGSYVKYEMFLRRLESKVNSLVGVSGSFFAVRREICRDWSATRASDFVSVIHAVKQGYRAVTDPESIGFYKTATSKKDEFRRKVRTVTRGISAVMSYSDILNPLKYGFFSVQVLSHKLLRWLVPLFMVSALASNIFLAMDHSFYRWPLAGQVLFYSLAALGLLAEESGHSSIFKIPAFFTLVNISIAFAWAGYVTGQRVTLWEPSKR